MYSQFIMLFYKIMFNITSYKNIFLLNFEYAFYIHLRTC